MKCETAHFALQNGSFYNMLYINILQTQNVYASADGITHEKDVPPTTDGVSQSVTSKRYSPDCKV